MGRKGAGGARQLHCEGDRVEPGCASQVDPHVPSRLVTTFQRGDWETAKSRGDAAPEPAKARAALGGPMK